MKNVKGTSLFHTHCEIWHDGTEYYVVAIDEIEESEFITSGVTSAGELVDSGFVQGNVSAREDTLVDHGSVAELILRGWGNLFPTIEE